MAKHKKAGVRKWNRAENVRYFYLYFPLCTMWHKGNIFFLSSLFCMYLPYQLCSPREIWPCNSEVYFTGELSAKNYTLTSAPLLTKTNTFYSPSPEYPVARAAQALTRCKRLRCMCAACATGMNGEVNRAVAQRAKAGWLRRNSAVIPRPALAGLRGASLKKNKKIHFVS